jgi:hypothetical protein
MLMKRNMLQMSYFYSEVLIVKCKCFLVHKSMIQSSVTYMEVINVTKSEPSSIWNHQWRELIKEERIAGQDL